MSIVATRATRVVTALAVLMTTACSMFRLPSVSDDDQVTAIAVREQAERFLVDELGTTVRNDYLTFQRQVRVDGISLLTYTFVHPSHADFTADFTVTVPPAGPVYAKPNLPPCAEQPEECEQFLNWDIALLEIPKRLNPIRSTDDFEFTLHPGNFVWEFELRGVPHEYGTSVERVVVDATSGRVLAYQETNELEREHFFPISGCVFGQTSYLVVLEGGMTGEVFRSIYSTTTSYNQRLSWK